MIDLACCKIKCGKTFFDEYWLFWSKQKYLNNVLERDRSMKIMGLCNIVPYQSNILQPEILIGYDYIISYFVSIILSVTQCKVQNNQPSNQSLSVNS